MAKVNDKFSALNGSLTDPRTRRYLVPKKIVLTQGLNRQIRRMCETRNYKVLQLKRVRIMNVFLASLKPGEYRELDDEECKMLYNQCR